MQIIMLYSFGNLNYEFDIISGALVSTYKCADSTSDIQ